MSHADEVVEGVEREGEGNMNCVVRVMTSRRSFILKQSRPWVEKYPGFAAPLSVFLYIVRLGD